MTDSNMPSRDRMVMSPAVDVGPMIDVPDRIALCSAHGWWYPSTPGDRCPEMGCNARTHHYNHSVSVSHDERDGHA